MMLFLFANKYVSKQKIASFVRGFTVVELMVSVAIFALMTALVVSKYGTFNQSIFLTNLAYDMALTIRTAQTYGLSVKSANDSSPDYTYAYGVNINTSAGTPACASLTSNYQQFVMFADADGDALCSNANPDLPISSYAIKRGAYVSQVCAGSSSCTLGTGMLTISFRRPDPRATICLGSTCTYSYAEIKLSAADGTFRKVAVHSNGQIKVME